MIQIGYFKGYINKIKHKKSNDEWDGVFGEGKGIDQQNGNIENKTNNSGDYKPGGKGTRSLALVFV